MIPFKVLFPRQDQDDRVAHPTAGCCAGGSACAPEDVSLLSLVVNSEPAKEKRGGGWGVGLRKADESPARWDESAREKGEDKREVL